jgi:hypothetical protein
MADIWIYKLKATVIEIDMFYAAPQIFLVVEGSMEHPKNQRELSNNHRTI